MDRPHARGALPAGVDGLHLARGDIRARAAQGARGAGTLARGWWPGVMRLSS